MRPTLTSRLYDNAGYKQEQSAFGKVGYTTGDWRFAADVQLRRAAFQYHPSVGAGISPFGTDWTFLNPKLSVAYTVRPGVELFGSWGRSRGGCTDLDLVLERRRLAPRDEAGFIPDGLGVFDRAADQSGRLAHTRTHPGAKRRGCEAGQLRLSGRIDGHCPRSRRGPALPEQ